MCLAKRNLPRKSRLFLAIGNLCMAAGLILSRFSGQLNWLHFLRGFLLGLAITLLFAALHFGRRNPQNQC
jgi:hypothetical protein